MTSRGATVTNQTSAPQLCAEPAVAALIRDGEVSAAGNLESKHLPARAVRERAFLEDTIARFIVAFTVNLA